MSSGRLNRPSTTPPLGNQQSTESQESTRSAGSALDSARSWLSGTEQGLAEWASLTPRPEGEGEVEDRFANWLQVSPRPASGLSGASDGTTPRSYQSQDPSPRTYRSQVYDDTPRSYVSSTPRSYDSEDYPERDYDSGIGDNADGDESARSRVGDEKGSARGSRPVRLLPRPQPQPTTDGSQTRLAHWYQASTTGKGDSSFKVEDEMASQDGAIFL
jgi:hypothetical protein